VDNCGSPSGPIHVVLHEHGQHPGFSLFGEFTVNVFHIPCYASELKTLHSEMDFFASAAEYRIQDGTRRIVQSIVVNVASGCGSRILWLYPGMQFYLNRGQESRKKRFLVGRMGISDGKVIYLPLDYVFTAWKC
jgi:hypothetical protein